MPSLSDRLSTQYQQQFGRPADANDPQYGAWVKTALPTMIQSDHDAYERSKRRWGVADRLAWGAVGAGLTAGLAPALFAGGAGASLPAAATQGVGFSSAGAAGGGMTLGNFLNIANLGMGSAASILGQRSNNRALDRQMLMQQREIDARLAADAEARAEARRQFDIQQQNEARRSAADDEERAFNRRLVEEREARLAPYRAMSDRARMRLASFLGL